MRYADKLFKTFGLAEWLRIGILNFGFDLSNVRNERYHWDCEQIRPQLNILPNLHIKYTRYNVSAGRTGGELHFASTTSRRLVTSEV